MKKTISPRYFVTLLVLFSIFVQVVQASGGLKNESKKILSPLRKNPSVKLNPISTILPKPVETPTSVATINPIRFTKGTSNNPAEFIAPTCDNWIGSKLKIKEETLKTLSAAGIKITADKPFEDNSGKCVSLARIEIGKETRADKYEVKFSPDEAPDLEESVKLEIIGAAAQTSEPIPPGLDPQVDVMWAVIPQKIVKDNFGPRVGKLFYGIEVVIGNNSGYALQIATVGFKLGPTGKAATVMAETMEKVAIAQESFSVDAGLTKIMTDCRIEAQGDILKYTDCVTNNTKTFLGKVEELNKQLVATAKSQNEALTKLSQLTYRDTLPVSSYPIARGVASHGEFWNARSLLETVS